MRQFLQCAAILHYCLLWYFVRDNVDTSPVMFFTFFDGIMQKARHDSERLKKYDGIFFVKLKKFILLVNINTTLFERVKNFIGF